MTSPLTADQATTDNMLRAFDTCQGECQSIAGQVDGAASNLAAVWQSDSASKVYANAITEWLTGFHKVRQGLDMLNGNMQSYAQLVNYTEDSNAGTAGGWARV